VVSTFTVTPAAAPAFVAVPHQQAVAGTEVVVQYHAPGGGRLVLAPAGTAPETISAARSLAGTTGLATLRVPTAGAAAGAWEAVLMDTGGTLLARQPYWLVAPGAKPKLTTTKRAFKSGEPIGVRWEAAPGQRWDYVALFPAVKPDIAEPLAWRHTKATVAGEAALDSEAEPAVWPLPPGKYSVKLLLDDGYTILAESPIEVLP
jgi:hypothetical protein